MKKETFINNCVRVSGTAIPRGALWQVEATPWVPREVQVPNRFGSVHLVLDEEALATSSGRVDGPSHQPTLYE
jgi:hypothetical protein